jgi:hypothetical protein
MQSQRFDSVVSKALRLTRKGAALLLVLTALSGVALGGNGQGQNGNSQGQNGNNQGQNAGGVPEIDPGAISGALALLGGGLLLLTARRRQ